MEKDISHYFSRDVINPPSVFEGYKFLTPQQSLEALSEAEHKGLIKRGEADLALGLLQLGGIAQFPGGLGLMYDDVYKNTFNTESAGQSLNEIEQSISGNVDCLLAPEHSGIIPAAQLAYLLNVPIIKIKKNGQNNNNIFKAQVDSYTGGERDKLYIEQNRAVKSLREFSAKNQICEMVLVDDILDTGAMTLAVDNIIEQMKDFGLSVSLKGVVALLEKKYTGAREKIKAELNIDVISGLVIEDIGLEPFPWMRIQGVDSLLSFSS